MRVNFVEEDHQQRRRCGTGRFSKRAQSTLELARSTKSLLLSACLAILSVTTLLFSNRNLRTLTNEHAARRSMQDLNLRTIEQEDKYRIPTFMIIGAQKAATSSLFKHLQPHPWINSLSRKELHYLDTGRKNATQYVLSMLSLSSSLTEKEKASKIKSIENQTNEASALETRLRLMSMDSTPSYLFHGSLIATWIRQNFPWVKIIVSLRDPVDRAYSAYRMWHRRDVHRRNVSFEELISADLEDLRNAGLVERLKSFPKETFRPKEFGEQTKEGLAWVKYMKNRNRRNDGIIGRGMYAVQLRRWLRYFPPESILVLNYEDLEKEDGAATRLQRVQEFLGLPHLPLEALHGSGRHQSHGQEQMQNETRALLEDFFRPYNAELSKMIKNVWNEEWEGTFQ